MKDKSVVIGVCGSIAAYKSIDLLRNLQKKNIDVSIIMTKSAQQFITPLTFKTLSNDRTYIDLFDESEAPLIHLELSKSDLIVIYPATANIMAKIANGIADDLLSTVLLAYEQPIIFAPAMNTRMYKNKTTADNVNKLLESGHIVIQPGEGDLACGEDGKGRLVDTDVVIAEIENYLSKRNQLKGKKIMVSAGPTREKIDLMRYVSNRSSGKMGYEIADELAFMGADVLLITGAADRPTDKENIELVKVETTEQMKDEVLSRLKNCDALIMAAAVADFKPSKTSENKIKRNDNIEIILVPTSDILLEVSKVKHKKDLLVVGFCAEDKDLENRAKDKLKKKKLDFIIANDISRKDIGAESDYNEVLIIDSKGKTTKLQKDTKKQIARQIIDHIFDKHYSST